MARLKEGTIVSIVVIVDKGWMAVFVCVRFPGSTRVGCDSKYIHDALHDGEIRISPE